jgi:hypothetical protein
MPASSLSEPSQATLSTIRACAIAGILACLAYAGMSIGRLPVLAVAVLVAVFGPALVIACYGLRQLLTQGRPRSLASLGLLLNLAAAAIFSMMGMIQLALAVAQPGAAVSMDTRVLWVGFDVAWDAFLCSGTACFALAMLRHPRFGILFALPGLAVAAGLMTLHLVTFPWPPQNRGLFDLGPAVGLWYLAVSIQMLRSLTWARSQLTER